MLELVAEAVQGGSRKSCACEALGLSLRTVQRWERGGVKDRRKGSRAVAANRLSEAERARVIDVLNAPAYRDKGPNQIVPLLADEGEYLASESTMYRILREEKQLAHRERSAPRRSYEPLVRQASAPNQVVELGHYLAAQCGTRVILLPVSDCRSLQPQDCGVVGAR